jgi:hypothetical protein
MPVPSLEYRQYNLLPAQVGNHWTVLICHNRQVHCHPEIATASHYLDAVRQAQRIVDGIWENTPADGVDRIAS